MRLFNRLYAAQGFEILAGITGLFACLAATEYLSKGSRPIELVALLATGTVLLSALAAASSGEFRVGLRSLLAGPWIASSLLAVVISFSDHENLVFTSRPMVALLFGSVAVLLFLAIRRLRAA